MFFVGFPAKYFHVLHKQNTFGENDTVSDRMFVSIRKLMVRISLPSSGPSTWVNRCSRAAGCTTSCALSKTIKETQSSSDPGTSVPAWKCMFQKQQSSTASLFQNTFHSINNNFLF